MIFSFVLFGIYIYLFFFMHFGAIKSIRSSSCYGLKLINCFEFFHLEFELYLISPSAEMDDFILYIDWYWTSIFGYGTNSILCGLPGFVFLFFFPLPFRARVCGFVLYFPSVEMTSCRFFLLNPLNWL